MIPTLPELMDGLGASVVLATLLLAGLFTATVLLVQSASQWFDDRNP